ncbi:hypothetical protein GLOIN_2v1869760 [Rhizophagus clarus]|uniref:MADF domain-containing protein n=1 Tax=Rhizophagus clarus TaxID=94130 RepID=A0A8H3KTD1_9GLOM|nr:hypothetical protein GLOIN_2v1869760 [Rhizophagus clarus]
MKGTKRKKQILKKEVKSNNNSTKWTDGKIKILLENKVKKLHKTYLQKKKKADSTGESSVKWIWFSQMEEILSQSKAINLDYITDLTSDFPPISDSENSNNSENSNDKENYKADEP